MRMLMSIKQKLAERAKPVEIALAEYLKNKKPSKLYEAMAAYP